MKPPKAKQQSKVTYPSPRHAVAREGYRLADDQVERLKAVFPEAFSEGKIDFEKLRATLGDLGDERPERYSFTWAGKRNAILELQKPTWGTLVPARDESVNFDTTQNVFIEGENLEVLKLLYKSYFGRVKLIYIDPPYNTGNDFVYPDNFADPKEAYLRITGQKDAEGNLLTSNPETSGRYHSAWLSMMYPRLFLARQLLRDDGLLFVSIDDHEVANLRLVLNEIFGEENFVANIVWQKRYVSNATAKYFSDMHDHVLVFAKDFSKIQIKRLERTEEQLADYKNPDEDERGPWRAQDLSASKPYAAGLFTITGPTGGKFKPPPGRYWRCNEPTFDAWRRDNRIWFGKDGTSRPMLKAFLSEAQKGITPNTWWSHDFAGHNKEATLEVKALFDGEAPFDTAKPVKLLKRCIELGADLDSIVMDFFAGSGSTAQAVLELNHEDGGNRRFILVQLPQPTKRKDYANIAEMTRERIRRVLKRMQKDKSDELNLEDATRLVDQGFVAFRLAPTNFKQWEPAAADAAKLAREMDLFADPLVEKWKPENLIYEVALREGFGVTARLERLPAIKSNKVWRITDAEKEQTFRICLDDEVAPETVRTLELSTDDLFICRDCALTDKLAANLALQCRLRTI